MDVTVCKEVRAVVNQLQTVLNSCISHFHSPCKKYPLVYCNTGGNGNAMSGVVLFHEDTICSMEILVKSTKISPVVKSAIREDKQWKLQQVQDAVNHLKQAKYFLDILSNHEKKVCPEYIVTLLEKVMNSVNMCRGRLFSPCKLSLKALVSSGIVKMFSPSLPGDTVVNIFTLEDSIVVCHYTVQQAHSVISKNNPQPSAPALFHQVGSMLEHAGGRYEISTAHRAECRIPWLTKVLEATTLMLQLGNELKRKLNSVQKHQNIFIDLS